MNVQNDTRKYYSERINKVIQYIDTHLNEQLDVKQLAAIGNYSPFHFHRIMKAYLNEPLVSYIWRIRLEYAAQLIKHTNEPISDVAFRVGYDNPSSFSKAFKKRFGIAPAEYRLNKINLMPNENKQTDQTIMKYLKSTTPKIKNLKAKKLIYVQAFGAYNESAKEAWEKVCEFAKKKHLFRFNNEFIGISFDNPEITEPNKIRYNACISVTKEVKPDGEMGYMEIPEGKYAIFTHLGSYDKLNDSYNYIYGQWLSESGLELRDQACLENYLNSPDKTKPEKLKTEILIPIK